MKRLGVEPASELQDLLLGERVLTQIEGRRLQVLPVEVVTLADPDEVTVVGSVAGSVAGSAGVGVVVASVVVTHGLHGRAVLGPDKQSVQTNNGGARSGDRRYESSTTPCFSIGSSGVVVGTSVGTRSRHCRER